jgi:hypothetical protein
LRALAFWCLGAAVMGTLDRLCGYFSLVNSG